MKKILLPFLLSPLVINAQEKEILLKKVDPNSSKVKFKNEIKEDQQLNYFSQDNIYNGSGVSIGDLNNDGLSDIYFVSNMGEDKIYLNKGNLKFKDISKKALGEQMLTGWKTGVLMADFNTDGWLDIYVTRYGLGDTPMNERTNLLYINNGDLTFTEKAIEFGVGDGGRTVHASVLDFDQDGDLDLFLVNHWKNASVMEQYKKSLIQEKPYSNRLLRNDNGKFTDITSFSNGTETHGYCLGASVGDINNDGWPDIYVTNDYNLPDFMLINRTDGRSFENQIKQRTGHTSHYSMGIDIADFNNDGNADICVLDMSNKDYKKSKTNMGGMSIDHFWHNVAKGYPHQYMYNTLFLNLGSGYFSEIAQMAGISSTDWSWAPLLLDLDRDGLKDLFVTNGYYRDVRDRDFTQILKDYLASEPSIFEIDSLLNLIPRSRDVNYIFQNKGDLVFQDKSSDWGITEGSISHGAAYGDLDNDGDLDLVINNLNEVATILENKTEKGHFFNVKLTGPSRNKFAVGAKIVLRCGTDQFMQELYPSRGYASSCDYVLNFGLGKHEKIDVLEVFWNHKEVTRLKDLKVDQQMTIDYDSNLKVPSGLFGQTYEHENKFAETYEAEYNDFKYELLIPNKMSSLGPFMSTGDSDFDGKADLLYVGAGRNYPGRLFAMNDEEKIVQLNVPDFKRDKGHEDGESIFFDFDKDGDLDLYVVSGGNEYVAGDGMYQDRLYINDSGFYKKSNDVLPEIHFSGQIVKTQDINDDGFEDIFIGGRQVPGMYPKNPESAWLVYENGHFINKIEDIAPGLNNIGMITDAEFTDLNGDKVKDLLIVGEWMEIQCWINKNGIFILDPDGIGLAGSETGINGWWNCIQPIDVNNDGRDEYLVGNLGLNNKFHPGPGHELRIYLDDFDKNGQYDIVLSKEINGIELPVRGKQCLSEQMPVISENYTTYTAFANATFNEIFEVPDDFHFVNNFSSGLLVWENAQWNFIPFPRMGQIGPINECVVLDLNGDEYMDFVAVGNNYSAEIETPRYDGNPGLVFINDGGTGNFRVYPMEINGGFANKDAKDAVVFGNRLLISNNLQGIYQARLSWY